MKAPLSEMKSEVQLRKRHGYLRKLCTNVVLKKSEREVVNFAEGNGDGETFEKEAKRVGNLSRACDFRSLS